ncbi:CBS domain-containing protein [Natronomonas sp. EA1]|uniref:CBS domain-containing protein n=1 Tax=Natronomonas sp. EA1 TaxID=3421655 RepID=UPI003EBECBFA
MPLGQLARKQLDLVTAAPETSIRDIANVMKSRKVGSVIIEREKEVQGIVTDRDIAMQVVAEGKDPKSTVARDVMTRNPVCADTNDGVAVLCRKMSDAGVRRMPVLEDGKLTGIITLDDLLVLIDGELDDLTDIIRAESPTY